jgi:uncharacterized membrane protein YheB (UPF0754 family)
MEDELDKVINGEEEKKTQVPPENDSEKESEDKKIEEEATKKQLHLTNLQKAIDEAEAELQAKRKAKKEIKEEIVDDTSLKIDLNDPSSKAWNDHINAKVQPVQDELEKEKKEIRTFALKEFLSNKPALAKKPEKLQEMMDVYDKIKTASERTKEGVLLDLNKSYAAVFHDELLQVANSRRIEDAENANLFTEPAISYGSTGYSESNERQRMPKLTQADILQLSKWGMTPQEWVEMKQTQDKKQI